MDSIIFDVDGTLWDSADSVAAAWNLAIKKFSSLDITLDREILGSVFGKTMTDIGDILFPSLSETEKDSLFLLSATVNADISKQQCRQSVSNIS